MTDPDAQRPAAPEPADSPDRAERAFTRALAEHASDHDFAPLDPAVLAARASDASDADDAPDADAIASRRRWRPAPGLVAAAALLVVVIPLAAVWWPRPFSGASAALPASAPGGVVAADSRSEAASGAQADTADAAGCPAVPPQETSPQEEAAAPVGAVTVCHYDGATLATQGRLTGADAQAVRDAVRLAPVVAEPVGGASCTDAGTLVLLFDDGAQVLIGLGSCGVIHDGGTIREVTRASCADVLARLGVDAPASASVACRP